MHPESMLQMTKILDTWKEPLPVNLLDVGSFNVNGCYRAMVEGRGWKYTGVDIVPGKNVDIVSDDPYNFPFDDGEFDIVISGSTLEHVQDIFRWVPELARMVRSGGMLAIITHTHWRYHPHKYDCWRIMPDGFDYLFNLAGCLRDWEISMYCSTDISGVAWKQ